MANGPDPSSVDLLVPATVVLAASKGGTVASRNDSEVRSAATGRGTSGPAVSRLRAFDWLRGGALLLMIQHHATDLLRLELRHTLAYAWLDRLDGLVAPAFLLTAGFALGLTQVRAGGSAARVRHALWRIGEVLLAATFVNWLWFPIFSQPRWLYRFDILHCIAFSLLLLLPLAAGLSRRPRLLSGVATAVGLAAFLIAPWAEAAQGPWANLLNVGSGSVFPLLPWIGHAALGLALGAAAARSATALSRWLVGLAALGVLVYLARPVWLAVLPVHAFWLTDPSVHGDRWAAVCLAALGLRWLEVRAPTLRAGVLATLAAQSLSAYVVHEALLYHQILGFSFQSWWGERCGWGRYVVLTFLLTGMTVSACRLLAAAAKRMRQLATLGNPAFIDTTSRPVH